MLKRILLTPGEPAGIGPDIILKLAQQAWEAELIVIADPALLRERANALGMTIQLGETDLTDSEPQPHQAGRLRVLPVSLANPVIPGKLNPANAAYVLETLELAARLCLQKKTNAIVTGPVNKAVINDAGIPFSGHTEFFAEKAGVDQTVMLFVAEQFKVALATTHLPLSNVAASISTELLTSVLNVLESGLKKWFQLDTPRIAVCGLNPHAGESGHLGREEIDIIAPLINAMQQQGKKITGPLPADSIFTKERLQQADAILAMYHDQALPLVKYASFGQAVNMTLGLPFLRTSVDHGTALDIAGTGKADAGSLEAALRLSIKLNQ